MKKVITFITALVVAAIFYACDTNNQSEDAVVPTTEVKEVSKQVEQSGCDYCDNCVLYITKCKGIKLNPSGINYSSWDNKLKLKNNSSYPCVGCVAVMDTDAYYIDENGNRVKAGHMAYVEKVFDSGNIYISEGNYKGKCNQRYINPKNDKVVLYYNPNKP